MSTPVKVLARGWNVFIDTGSGASIWTEIKGLTNLIFDGEKTNADTTTFESGGDEEHQVASRSKTLGLEGQYLEDQNDGGRDPGQEAVEKLADQVGANSIGNFKLVSPAGTVRYFSASANVSGIGGSKNDPTGWKADLDVSGGLNFDDVAVTSIEVIPETVELGIGEVSDLLSTSFTPGNATDKGLTYASNDTTVAAVTNEGRIVGISTGSATITVTASGGTNVTDTVAVTVST